MSQAMIDHCAQEAWSPSIDGSLLDRAVALISSVERMEPPIHPYEAMDSLRERVDELDELLQLDASLTGDALVLQAESAIMAMYRFMRSIAGDV